MEQLACLRQLAQARGTRRRSSHSIAGRIATARMKPRKMTMTSFSFDRPTTTRDYSPLGEDANAMVTAGWEKICLEERRHPVVLLGPFARALGLAAVGLGLMAIGWPATIGGVLLQAAGAAIALRAVWEWERTRLVLTTEKLFVVHGTLRKRAAAVRLSRIGAVEIEQGLLGRILGYGTIVAGDLEVEYVPEPRRVYGLVERLSA